MDMLTRIHQEEFVEAFDTGCAALHRSMARKLCHEQQLPYTQEVVESFDLPSCVPLRLQTIADLLTPPPCRGFAELMIDNMMHQVSLCIASDKNRREFVQDYRTLFPKQSAIASRVQAAWLSKTCNDSGLVSMFARMGHVNASAVRWEHQAQVHMLCMKVVPQIIPGTDTSEGQHLSSAAELRDCADFVKAKCNDLLLAGVQPKYDKGLKHGSDWSAREQAEKGDASSSRRRRRRPQLSVTPPVSAASVSLDFDTDNLDF